MTALAVTLLALAGGSGLFAQPVDILLDHAAHLFYGANGKQKTRPAVAFPHEWHLEVYDCLDCHHIYEDGQNVLDPGELVDGNPDIACAACHYAGSRIGLKHAFHQQCVGCHLSTKPKYWIAGEGVQWKSFLKPFGGCAQCCGECHVRRPPIEMPWE